MRENNGDANIGLGTLNELEALKSAILKYFKGKSESPLKKDESLILSAMDIYFNGGRES
jgi:hypothetical protein